MMSVTLPKMTDGVANISSLADRPVMTAAALKAAFDKAGGDIKDYINDTLIPALEEAIGSGGGGTGNSWHASANAPVGGVFAFSDLEDTAEAGDLIVHAGSIYLVTNVDEDDEEYDVTDTGDELPAGADGKSVELQATASYIQWKQDGGSWTNLVALADITGPAGDSVDLRVDSGYIQYKQGSGSWTNLVDLDDITGPAGEDGADGNYWHASANAPVDGKIDFTDIIGTAKVGDLVTHEGTIYVVTAVDDITDKYSVTDTGDELPSGGSVVISTSTDTNLTGLLKGNGSKVAAAVAGTDYQAPLVAGTDYATPGSVPSAATATPLVDGTAAIGSSSKYAKEDHVHPTDSGRMAASLKGAANGVAELDADQKVAAAQASSKMVTVSGSTTLALTHAGKRVQVESASAVNITVPTNSAVAFPVGTEIEICRWGSGSVTIKASAAVTVCATDGSTSSAETGTDVSYAIAAQYVVVCLKKITNNMWHLQGAIS